MTGHIAFLGLGAMGQRMARRLLDAGHPVVVWNRDTAKTLPLQAAGARVSTTPAEATRGAAVVLSMVRDDVASRRVWLAPGDGALDHMGAGAVALECSTLSHAWSLELAAAAAARGVAFLDAPVAGSRPQAESGLLIHLVGGDAQVLQRVEPVLKAWSAAVAHVGPNGSGALVKLMLNQLFAVQVVAMAELIGLARGLDADVSRLVDAMAATPVCSPALRMAAQAMLAHLHAPQFPIALVQKDMVYVADAAAAVAASLPVADAVRQVFEMGVEAHLGSSNITAIAQLYGSS